ncbi:tRNA synthetases class I (M)-domain-containing protein [Paraphysoderma sedebokerense]|nr:tRNA synthetases class I (M)-domain-containing protein [Paraphysoderma sedebokerense]KAI9142344.1 tRNA synthetases class I (M)-domain-containing protein [Paraphysoderma sedebokerense]
MAPSKSAPSSTPDVALLLPSSIDSSSTANSLKVIIALALSNTKYAISKSTTTAKAPLSDSRPAIELVKSEKFLFDANAIVSYFLSPSSPQSLSAAAKSSHIIEVESTKLIRCVLQLIESPKPEIESTLSSVINDLTPLLPNLQASPKSVESVIIFSTLHTLVNSKKPQVASFMQKHDHIKNFVTKMSVVPELAEAVKTASKLLTATASSGVPAVVGSVEQRKVRGGIEYKRDPKVKVLPKQGQRNVLVTSALPYVNNEPHLGNIIGCVLSADAFARFGRLRGYNVLYVCGTDEYGTATETKALEEKISCQALCDKYHALHKGIYEYFSIDFDYFGRTTTEWQTKIAQDIFNKLNANNYAFEQSMTQLFCETCQRFLADRYVEGTCPFCGYEDARGDQCDACQKLLNAVDLINPRCKLDSTRPVTKESSHMFLDLPKLQDKCENFVKTNSQKGKWSSNSISITNGWLKEGLKPRCITRDLKWGTPVPLESMKNKVFYVWFDAPIGYLSITANYTDKWELWWKNPKNVDLYQFMGKDNIPFHTVIFPSSLLGSGDDYTLLHHVSTTEYLNYESGKFSKSRKTGVFGSNVKDTGIPVDVWRYYLFINRPESNDSAFSWKDFISRNNNELLANLGNFVNRVLKFLASPKYQSTVPKYEENDPADEGFKNDINELLKNYIDAFENVKLRLALQIAMSISARGNQYLQDNKLDNSLFVSNPQRCNNVIANAINLVYLLAPIFYPFMPNTADGICRQLNVPMRKLCEKWEYGVDEGHVIGKPDYLFKRIEEKMEDVYRVKYAGTSAGGAPDAKKVENGAAAATNGAAKPDGKKSKRGGASSKKAAAPDPVKILESFKGTVPADVLELKKKVEVQGELIRNMKAEKADAGKIKGEVEFLLKLKGALGEAVNKLVASN